MLLMAAVASKAESVTATWDFHSSDGNYYAAGSANVQGSVGTLDATASDGSTIVLTVDASSGKLYSRGGDAQFNNGTIIKVPVQSTSDVVTVVSYPNYHYYTIGGIAAEADETSHTATAAEVSAKCVEIVATNTAYLFSISVTQAGGSAPVAQDITATWDFGNADVMEATMAFSGSNTAGEVEAKEKNGVKMTVEANGASFRNNGNNIQVQTGAVFKIPVRNDGDLITVKGYPNYSKYTIGNSNEIYQNTSTNPETTYKATRSDAKAGYVAVTSADGNNYYYSITVVQYAPSEGPVLTEKSIYKTDFSDWEALTASKENTDVAKSTKFSNETLTFTFYNTGVNSGDYDVNKFPNNNGYRIYCPKNAGASIVTSALANITKIRYIHGATGSNRGYKLEAKGDGDEDWVTISDSYASPAGWCEVTKDINKTNVQLRFTNLSESNYAYIFELEIFGNVDLSGAPMLGSFSANGKTITGESFEMGNDGNYAATIELFKNETMISESNPIADVVADNGEIGTITYAGDADNCIVTIPVTANSQTVNYIANFVRKPIFTLTYVATDGSTLGTQQVEKDTKIGAFDYDINNVSAIKNGYKARGWYKQNYVGEKYTTESVVTEDIKLYAVETEIEVASLSKEYEFKLNDKLFYAEDHDAFTLHEDAKCKFHDTTHGWSAYNGDKIDLLVGPKAIISITVCQYGSGTNILVKKGEETLATLAGKDDTDAKIVSYSYEGEATTLTLEMVAGGEMYIHNVKISNVSETNYQQDGQWFIVKAGDTSSFLDALKIANGVGGTDRVFIFLPNGTYDLGTAVQTPISRDNISLIGQSTEGVNIKNAPPVSMEGLTSASTIHNTGNNLYMQDLTLQNELDYYGAGAAGRANAFHDGGNRTIAMNVKLLSYQDTYLTAANKQTYWEGSEIHGTVDFICGGGDVFFEGCKLVTETRKKGAKSGETTLTAHQPQTAEKFGYVFNNCTIENQSATFNYGRAWGGASGATFRPTVTYLNTTLNQPNEISQTRFTTKAMNSQTGIFHEYNSKDKDGNVVSPASNVLTFTNNAGEDKLTYETILTAEEAAGYTIDKVFTDWTPADYARQLDAPANAQYDNGTVTWLPANNGAIAYLLEKNGEYVGITEGSSYNVTVDPAKDILTIRAANTHGGFGPAVTVATTVNAINAAKANDNEGDIVNVLGMKVKQPKRGIYIVNKQKRAFK